MPWHLTFHALRVIRRSRYLLLLIALLVLLVAYPFWGRDVVGLATFDIMLWGVLLGGLWALHRNRGLLRVALAMALAAFLANVGTYLFPTREAVLVSCLLDLALLIFVTAIILSHVVEEGKVDADRIFGAVCGYLLIGLTWALIYGALDLVQPGSFDLGEAGAPADAPEADPAPHFADMDPFLYYSLVTLSTLGYGDIVAVTRAARSLSALEAVVGQLYIAVVVARLIGLQIIARRREGP
jgi:hypothetical protein